MKIFAGNRISITNCRHMKGVGKDEVHTKHARWNSKNTKRG